MQVHKNLCLLFHTLFFFIDVFFKCNLLFNNVFCLQSFCCSGSVWHPLEWPSWWVTHHILGLCRCYPIKPHMCFDCALQVLCVWVWSTESYWSTRPGQRWLPAASTWLWLEPPAVKWVRPSWWTLWNPSISLTAAPRYFLSVTVTV